jgi:hypothetical protein
VQTATTVEPAATAALIPEGESSKITARFGSIPKSAAASKKGSGKGLPRRRRTSSAVTHTSGMEILDSQHSILPLNTHPVLVKHPWQYVFAPEVATAYLPAGRESINFRTPGRIRTLISSGSLPSSSNGLSSVTATSTKLSPILYLLNAMAKSEAFGPRES